MLLNRMYFQKNSYNRFFTKVSIGMILAALAYIVCFTPAAEAQSPSRFEGADIVITNTDTSFHNWSGGSEKFEVVEGTLAEVLYFADPEVVDGEVWRKLRVADGNYGYVQEDSLDAFTGTIPTMWLEIDYQPSQVHLNYEARKGNYDIVIDAGVEYINPNEDDLASNDTGSEEEEEEDTTEEEDEDTAEDEDEEDTTEEESEEDEENELSSETNRELLLLIIKLLQELLSMKLQSMQS